MLTKANAVTELYVNQGTKFSFTWWNGYHNTRWCILGDVLSSSFSRSRMPCRSPADLSVYLSARTSNGQADTHRKREWATNMLNSTMVVIWNYKATAAKAVGTCSFTFTEHSEWMTWLGRQSPHGKIIFKQWQRVPREGTNSLSFWKWGKMGRGCVTCSTLNTGRTCNMFQNVNLSYRIGRDILQLDNSKCKGPKPLAGPAGTWQDLVWFRFAKSPGQNGDVQKIWSHACWWHPGSDLGM